MPPDPVIGTIISSTLLKGLQGFLDGRKQKQRDAALRRQNAQNKLVGSLSSRGAQSSQGQQPQPQQGQGIAEVLASDPLIAKLLAEQIDKMGIGSLLDRFMKQPKSIASRPSRIVWPTPPM